MAIRGCLILVAFIGLIVFSVQFSNGQDNARIATMNAYKNQVEQSYKDGKFLMPFKEIDGGLSYKITMEGNKIQTDYNGLAHKGKQWTSIELEVKKEGDKFIWVCKKDKILMDFEC